MEHRLRLLGSLVITAVALGCFAPTVAAQVQSTWTTTSSSDYNLMGVVGDLNHDGILDMVARETPGAPKGFISVRSMATGAIQAQSAVNTHQPQNLFSIDLDGDGPEELLFTDAVTGALVCLPFAPPGPMVPRWSLTPYPSFTFFFADLDGNGQRYVVFQANTMNGNFSFYRNTGALVNHYSPNEPPGWVLEYYFVEDVDSDGREEILLVYRDPDGFEQRRHFILLESVAPVGVESQARDLRAVQLGMSIPNPTSGSTRIDYTVPSRGRVSLRLHDVGGRMVRVLVDGVVEAGRHQAVWDGRDDRGQSLPAGMYFYELNAGGLRQGRQIVRLR